MATKELTSEKLLELLKEDPRIRRVLAAEGEKEKILKERKETAARLLELKKERERELPVLQEAARKLKIEMETARAHFRETETAWGNAERALQAGKWNYDQRIAEAQGFLKKTASEQLKKRIDEYKNEISAIQNKTHSRGDDLGALEKRIEDLKFLIAETEERAYKEA